MYQNSTVGLPGQQSCFSPILLYPSTASRCTVFKHWQIMVVKLCDLHNYQVKSSCNNLLTLKPAPLVSFQVESLHTTMLDFFFLQNLRHFIGKQTNHTCANLLLRVYEGVDLSRMSSSPNPREKQQEHKFRYARQLLILWCLSKDRDMHFKSFQQLHLFPLDWSSLWRCYFCFCLLSLLP